MTFRLIRHPREAKIAAGGHYYFLEYGIFTRENIQPSEFLLEYGGKLISVDEAIKLEKIYKKKAWLFYVLHSTPGKRNVVSIS